MLKRIFKSNVFLSIIFVYCLPLCVFMMYKYKSWKDVWKIIVGGLVVALISFLLLGYLASVTSNSTGRIKEVNRVEDDVKLDGDKGKSYKIKKYDVGIKKNIKKEAEKKIENKNKEVKKGESRLFKSMKMSRSDVENELVNLGKSDKTFLTKRTTVDNLVYDNSINREIANKYFKEIVTIYLKKSYLNLVKDYDILKLMYKVLYVQEYFRDNGGTGSDGYRYSYYYRSMLNNLLIYPYDPSNEPLAKDRRDKSEYYLYKILKGSGLVKE